MKFTNKIGVYTVQARALENLRKMQCRPGYLRYKARLAAICRQRYLAPLTPISYRMYCQRQIRPRAKQARLI